jgi:hypothetical protein
MKFQVVKSWAKYALTALVVVGSASAIYGDTVVATYQPATVQTPNTTNLCAGTSACWVGEQTFASSTKPASGAFPTLVSSGTATGGSISGSYSGNYSISPANQFGGAGGNGYFATVSNNSYTLKLTTSGNIPGVNYFGLWFSALDNGNDLKFYETVGGSETLLYDFTPKLFSTLVGACSASNAFCGNPNSAFKGQDSSEQFAFLNFFDTTGYFDQIVFTETTTAGFESDNHTVAYLNPPTPSGTVIGATPEPGTLTLLSTGVLALMNLRRRFALKGQK